MTRRISLVAVCCSSASVSSEFRASSAWASRSFSRAIAAWSAKVRRSAICFAVNGRTRARQMMMSADGGTIPEQRHREHGAEMGYAREPRISSLRDGRLGIVDVDRAAVQDGAAARQLPGDRDHLADRSLRLGSLNRFQPEPVTLQPVDVGIRRVAEARGGPRDGPQDRWDVHARTMRTDAGPMALSRVVGGGRLRMMSLPGCPH